MTKLTILTRGETYVGFCVEGHSDYGDSGSDIVCAAVSSAVQLVMLAITEVMNIPTEASVDSENAKIEYLLPEALGFEEKKVTDIILKAFEKNCLAICEEYSQYVQTTRMEV